MDKKMTKQRILQNLATMKKNNEALISTLCGRCSILDYSHLVRQSEYGEIWTEALQAALYEHEIVEIPSSKKPYFVDNTIIVPSNRRIIAWRAVVKLVPECEVLLLRNENVKDCTDAPLAKDVIPDRNISICGGCWSESNSARAGYGKSGRFAPKGENDENRPFYGVSTCMLFNNVESITLTNVTFENTAGFSVQLGNAKNAVFENIWFNNCFADGLHFGGNCENIIARHIYGEVGDDIIAINAYDWLNSTVTFGAIKNILCDDVRLAPMSCYKAIRIEPGVYAYKDGSKVDCAIIGAIIKNVCGIKTFKMYFQSPPYIIGEEPEKGEVGSLDDVFFDDITVDLNSPIDAFGRYLQSDPVRGSFAAFELGANIGYICFENIDIWLYKDEFPLSYPVCIGPKSIISGGKEIFDPYISSHADTIEFKNITINGNKATKPCELLREISFDDVNGDGRSTASGKAENVVIF